MKKKNLRDEPAYQEVEKSLKKQTPKQRDRAGAFLESEARKEETATKEEPTAREILTMSQAAEFLQVSLLTVKRQAKAGKLKTFKIGKLQRVRLEALREFARQAESAS